MAPGPGKSHFGYKLHASIDKRYKLVRKVIISNAAVADTTVFEDLLDPNNTSRDVYADRGYQSAEREATLNEAGWRVQIQRKGSTTKPISQTQKQRDRCIAAPPAPSNTSSAPCSTWEENWWVAQFRHARRGGLI